MRKHYTVYPSQKAIKAQLSFLEITADKKGKTTMEQVKMVKIELEPRLIYSVKTVLIAEFHKYRDRKSHAESRGDSYRDDFYERIETAIKVIDIAAAVHFSDQRNPSLDEALNSGDGTYKP